MDMLVNAGPIELTTDLVFRTAILASDPYKYSEEPVDAQWVRKGTDHVPSVLIIPLRAAVELGPAYVRAGIAGQLDVAAGLRF